jgi:hypothetical protein
MFVLPVRHAVAILDCMTIELLKPKEVDLLLRYPSGRSQRLARQGKIPHVLLPDGEIRFRQSDIERLTTGLLPEGPR